ncbi:tRNA synthetases class II core domain (F)-domain-containing protein [Cantharellus anzutake]|uniref:tRNA synthetases class II core domain (F)-domain-containing protein n=1 Tax=Cantharellus anzutake TaxID=1750568 RepID=UPI001905CBB7|nr:tRNA synthetases class II core domain (F)-domain-containing protein [Cantharellus anzutake]KAF8341638.1 tRNA synthetases class II core domain (F)-domain-containing protein [Cantharellus anzutake]
MSQELQQLILDTLEKDGEIKDTRTIIIPGESRPASTQDAQLVIQGALNSLLSREMITYTTQDFMTYDLTPEGLQLAEEGSHEARVWAALPLTGQGKGLTVKQLQGSVGAESAKIGQGRAFKAGWIGKEGDTLVKIVTSIVDATSEELKEIKATGTLKAGEKSISELKKRKLILQRKLLWFTVNRGPNFSTSTEKPETDLTFEMLATGAWKTATFKKYNFEAEGMPTNGGALHPLLKVREEFRNIFLEMGFAEMATSQFVDSGFWNFDTLFVPQQHPARELQDTFYLSDPVESLPPVSDYYERVRKVHVEGDGRSIGYRAPWQPTESRRLLLRTHTTATSSRLLHQLANRKGGFQPVKMFSIDRVFRNEAVDATHLAEFHQVEGVVADVGLTLGDLIGFMQTFFSKMGIRNLRFKPAYNPYTEPSLEIFAFHPQLNKWVEIGNSGMFRPEMLEPMGLPPDVRALGWGLSLERPTMIRHVYGINNIRTLVGHKVSIESVERAPAVRF